MPTSSLNTSKLLPVILPLSLVTIAGCQSSTEVAASAPVADAYVVTTQEKPTKFVYGCESGANINVDFRNPEVVIINYGETPYTLNREVSGSGARYSNSDVIWLTKGPQGMLIAKDGSGMEAQRLETCQQDT